MEQQADVFKDDTINGILLSIQNLQHRETEENKVVHKVTKYNPLFRNLINYLDLAFSFGLKDAKRGYWPFVKRIAHSSVIEMVEQHKDATSDIKKGYIWLFLTFVENSLCGYIRMMISNEKLLKLYYKNYALLHDDERAEILLTLWLGLETFTFSIDFNDPYLDFGHDPILRQEKVIIRIDSPALKKKGVSNVKDAVPQQPDVTIHPPSLRSAAYPDLLEAPQNLLVVRRPGNSSPQPGSSGAHPDLDLVQHEDGRYEPHNETGAQGKKKEKAEVEVVSLSGSFELAEDNYIPEVACSPGYSLLVADDTDILVGNDGCLQMSDVGVLSPECLSNSSFDEDGYDLFDEDDKKENNIVFGGCKRVEKNDETSCKETSILDRNEEEQFSQVSPVTDKIQKLTVSDGDGYFLTYVSDASDVSDIENVVGIYNEEDKDVEISPRTDSFDGFCREEGGGSTCSEDSAEWLQRQTPSLKEVAPLHISYPSHSYVPQHNAGRMSESRHSTDIGFLLPTLPRRPDLKEALQRNEEIVLDQSEQILLTLEIFNHPTELPVRMFQIYIGSLVGLNCVRYLLVSTMSIYLLEKKDAIHSGYVSMISIETDNIKKVQTSLNFQDVYIIHDNGCFHVSTADEVITRSIILAIKSVIKSSKYNSVEAKQPMADNTNNELELIIKDWLICHTGVEEPQLLYFALVQFSVLSNECRGRVLKSGYAFSRHVLIAGVKTPWDNTFFALRGHMLYKYTSRGNEVKNVYDLSKKCGGCVHSGTDGERFSLKLLGSDGSSALVELGVDSESEANDWVMTICKVVADVKNGPESLQSAENTLVNCGLVTTYEKIYFFNQDPKSGRLTLEDTCSIADISQVCVDNENRTYCTFVLDHNIESDADPESSKGSWLLNFRSEYELGKFEQRLYSCWESLYQVPLQFVLLTDITLKRKIESLMSQQGKYDGHIGQDLLTELINN